MKAMSVKKKSPQGGTLESIVMNIIMVTDAGSFIITQCKYYIYHYFLRTENHYFVGETLIPLPIRVAFL